MKLIKEIVKSCIELFCFIVKENKGFIAFAGIIIIAVAVISWLATCGIIKIITLCFGLQFSWIVATGIWLVLCILKSVFKKN